MKTSLIRDVGIVSYEFNSDGQVVLNYTFDGQSYSEVLASHQLGMLASRLDKTVVQILSERAEQ